MDRALVPPGAGTVPDPASGARPGPPGRPGARPRGGRGPRDPRDGKSNGGGARPGRRGALQPDAAKGQRRRQKGGWRGKGGGEENRHTEGTVGQDRDRENGVS